MRPEYDLASLRGGKRGKYFDRARSGGNVVLLEPDVARDFPDARSVNEALRALSDLFKQHGKRKRAG